MGWDLVSQGSAGALVNLPQYEDQLEEGSRNLLLLDLRLPVTEGVAQTLENALRDAGVEDVRVMPINSPQLRIYFTKGFPWLAVIVGIILASLVIAALVIAWTLFTLIVAVASMSIGLLIGIILSTGNQFYRDQAIREPSSRPNGSWPSPLGSYSYNPHFSGWRFDCLWVIQDREYHSSFNPCTLNYLRSL